MNTRVIMKEARPLFWPWCAVMLTGLVSLIRPLHSINWIGPFGIVLGIPLLATLPLGNEFQNRTLSLLMSQPIGRTKIWAEKLFVSFLAVASAALVYSFSPHMTETLPYSGQRLAAAAIILALVASATFWTLLARSTMGGIALSVGALLAIAVSLSLITGIGEIDSLLSAHLTLLSVSVLLCYAALMLWLGERAFARYQVTGNMAGDDLLTAGPDIMPAEFSDWFRARPTGATLNLIRKELRLLRPIWLITFLAAAGWTCFTGIEMLRGQRAASNLAFAVALFVGISCAVIVATLAGCLSLGEEKTSGTYAWHRTLPVSPLRQWLVKLFVAFSASLICAGLIPLLLMGVGRHFFPQNFPVEDSEIQMSWVLLTLFLTSLSFWCACAVDGTVSSVLWIAPLLIVFIGVPEIGNWVVFRLEGLLLKFDLFANLRFTLAFSHLSAHLGMDIGRLGNLYVTYFELALVWIPAFILALAQSYRLFCSPIRNTALSVLRKLSPLILLAFLSSLVVSGLPRLSNDASASVRFSVYSIDSTIQKNLSDPAKRESAQPLQLTVDDPRSATRFRWLAPRWLSNVSITVTPDKMHPTTCCATTLFRRAMWNYTAVVHVANGAILTFSSEPTKERPTGLPELDVSVHWPDGRDETILRR
jgi:hypothetical protein